MTLSTDVYVLDAIDPHEVFKFCQNMLTVYDDRPARDAFQPQHFTDEQDRSYAGAPGLVNFVAKPENAWTIANEPMQGLPAWLMLHYRPGAPLRVNADECTENCDLDDDDEPYHSHPEACWLSVDFDTSYSYKDSSGRGCGELHALLVAELGAMLTERGVRWKWRNEFTGEVHSDPEALVGLCKWFNDTVMPLIVSVVLEENNT